MSHTSTDRLPRVFVVGSSITIQFGPYLEAALQGKFHYDRKRATDGKQAEDNLDIPQGASAGDSGMVLAYLRHRRQHDPIPADILLLSCGMHDLKTNPRTGEKQVPLERFQSNMGEIVRETEAMGLKLAWLRITPVVDEIHNSRCSGFHRFAADVERYNAVADRIMADAGAHVIDLHALCQTLIPDAFIDHVHYNEAAREKQAQFIADDLSAWMGRPA